MRTCACPFLPFSRAAVHPFFPANDDPPLMEAKPPRPRPPGRTKVLVVEDDALVALGFLNRLAARGYVLAGVATTQDEAVRIAADHRPDVAVVDIRLREGSGIAAADAIRRNFATSVLFVSAFCGEHAGELPAGTWCLPKPCAGPDVVAAVDALCRSRAGIPPGPLPAGLFQAAG